MNILTKVYVCLRYLKYTTIATTATTTTTNSLTNTDMSVDTTTILFLLPSHAAIII